MPPPSDIVLALRGEVVYLVSIEVGSGNGDNDASYSIRMDGDSSDEDSVDQQTMGPLFYQVSRCTAYK